MSGGDRLTAAMDPLPAPDYAERPLLVYWELTRACDLACRHCRAEAIPLRSTNELTTAEGLELLRAITRFGSPMPRLVLTGGDPMKRPDLLELITAARSRGIPVSLTPSVTPNLTPDVIARWREAGVDSVALSLDGSTPAAHDGIRGIRGTFQATLEAAVWIRRAGLPLQINTLVARETVDDLPRLARLVKTLGVMRWSLFFLIPVGRGRLLNGVDAPRAERVLHWVLELASRVPFAVKTTEAMHVRRIAVQRLRRQGWSDEAIRRTDLGRGFGINDGKGIVFVSAEGWVYPSGFLPLPAGNVRHEDLVALYRESPLLRALRDPRALGGKCGACEFAAICGGSRARAYATSGDPLASDPLCPYQPPAWRARRASRTPRPAVGSALAAAPPLPGDKDGALSPR